MPSRDDTTAPRLVATDPPGLPATGRTFRNIGAGVGLLRDGKIFEVTEYWNLALFLQQSAPMAPGVD